MNPSRLVAKQVGVSGHISLGKEYTGRTVLIDSSEPGVWVIKTAQTIPDSELWLHQPEASARLDRAFLAIIEPPSAADLDAHLAQLPGCGNGGVGESGAAPAVPPRQRAQRP
ncbi:hypothetical protein KQ304_11780 [Synechococcus sp. CS-1329]|jgi:hypothetical protein|uniref:hypothetical protein n=1 Tax=Synechococcus sp. CS-1329 TaxID=2847975 RepID=UPI00223C35AE|nr:hypothetical protein [Synechococcus sp. CS-1329]MCT0219662.1 hypothetical protein [Synechococcus sp. CS-1329]